MSLRMITYKSYLKCFGRGGWCIPTLQVEKTVSEKKCVVFWILKFTDTVKWLIQKVKIIVYIITNYTYRQFRYKLILIENMTGLWQLLLYISSLL